MRPPCASTRPFGHGEPEAATLRRGRPGDPVEGIEEVRQGRRRYAGTAIGDLDPQRIPARRTDTLISAPAGVYFTAFSIRFESTWSIST